MPDRPARRDTPKAPKGANVLAKGSVKPFKRGGQQGESPAERRERLSRLREGPRGG